MSFLKAVEGGIAFLVTCGLGFWALSRWSKTPDPTDKQERKPFKPMRIVKLDDYEEALGGEDLKVADSQRN